MFEHALIAPVRITRRGTKGYVLLSSDEYERLETLDGAYWSDIAKEARKSGSIGAKAFEIVGNFPIDGSRASINWNGLG